MRRCSPFAPREAAIRISPTRLIAVAIAVAVGLFFWHSTVLYPLKLLVVFLHEAGHALAALLVGGSVKSIALDPREGGMALLVYEPGFINRVVTGSAGYLGSALSGAALIYLTLRRGSGRLVLWILCVFLAAITLIWGRSLFTFAAGLGLAAALGLAAKFLPSNASQLVAFFIAVFNGLYALFDLKDDLWSGSARRGQTDAALLADATGVPAVIWAALWTLIAVALIGFAVWKGAHARPPARGGSQLKPGVGA